MKYIIIKDMGCELGIMFNEILKHDTVAGENKALAAGFCDHAGNTWGRSVTLGVGSRPEDKAILIDALDRAV